MNMTGNQFSGFLHRWYDQDLHVSELVKVMSGLSDENQYLLALLIGALSEEVIKHKGKSNFVQELDWDKLMGILKSKRGRRWYDEEPEMHKAFNILYSLPDMDKAWVGEQLHMPSLLIESYERRCKEQGKPVDLEVVCQILEVTFKQGIETAQAQFAHF
ncbi:MAG: hypothetical protein VKJ04_06200 [Vampirovibrionales bacterium]|nr:hypothetical protein [Vampirovibrionales bacterium]